MVLPRLSCNGLGGGVHHALAKKGWTWSRKRGDNAPLACGAK